MTALELIKKMGLEQIGRFYSIYRGIVVDNPENDTNCLIIRVPCIYDGVKVVARPKGQAGGPNTGFQYLLPKPGSIVYVEFEYGDISRALWSYHGWAVEERPDEMDEDTIGFITPNGNKVLLKENDGVLEISTKSAIKLNTSEDNHIEILEEDGIVEIKTASEINLSSPKINFIEGKVGIPESNKIVTRLNSVEDELTKLINAIKSAPIIPMDGGLTFKTSIVATMAVPYTKTQLSDITSDKIKQPN